MSNEKSVPSYRRHKQSGQAIVTLRDGCGGRRDILLGKYGTQSSRIEYARVIAEWEASGNRFPRPALSTNLTLNELMLSYWQFAEGYYHKNSQPTKQLDRVKRAGVPHWHPNQLRHTKATEIRRDAGLDAARVVLGHRSPQMTEVYAEIDVNKAAEVMARLG